MSTTRGNVETERPAPAPIGYSFSTTAFRIRFLGITLHLRALSAVLILSPYVIFEAFLYTPRAHRNYV
jgi:hypothetical protein